MSYELCSSSSSLTGTPGGAAETLSSFLSKHATVHTLAVLQLCHCFPSLRSSAESPRHGGSRVVMDTPTPQSRTRHPAQSGVTSAAQPHSLRLGRMLLSRHDNVNRAVLGKWRLGVDQDQVRRQHKKSALARRHACHPGLIAFAAKHDGGNAQVNSSIY